MTTKTFWTMPTALTLALLSACSASTQSTEDNRATLEEVTEQGTQEDWIAQAKSHAQKTVATKSLQQLKDELIPYEHVYLPQSGEAPFPTVLFMHGCSGPTTSHEQDWAERYNQIGVAVIAIDSYKGRGVDWNAACNFQSMTPWQRSADIVATIESLKERDTFDENTVFLTGFSHGALTIWTFLEQLSSGDAPLSLSAWPQTDYTASIKGTFMFYGTCRSPWTVDIDSLMFIGDEDRYINAEECRAYQHPSEAGDFDYVIYPGATHTFDHAKPNKANVEAGSRYDETATLDAWQRIKEKISENTHGK